MELHNEPNMIEYILSASDIPGKSGTSEDSSPKTEKQPDMYPLSETENKQAAMQVKRITDEMPGGFFIYHAYGKEELLYANHAMVRLLGCDTMEEFLEYTGNSFRGIVHPDDLEEVEKSIAEQISHSQYDLDYVEYRIIRKDGEVRWIDDYGHFIRSEFLGDVFYVFVGDATEKKKRQQDEKDAILTEKEREEQKFQNQIENYDRRLEIVNEELHRRLELIEGLSMDYEAIFYIDLDTKRLQPYRVTSHLGLQYGDEHQVYEFAGFDPEYIRTWICPEDQELFAEATSPEYIRKQLSISPDYYVHYRIIRGGKTEHLQMRVVSVGKTKQISQIVMGFRSVDDEIMHEMEQKEILEVALRQAKSANAAKNVFLDNMSHDLRTPMNVIAGYTALAKNHIENPEKLQGYLDKIQKSCKEMLHLINDVLEISKLEAGELTLEETWYSLQEVLESVQNWLQLSAAEKNIIFSMDMSGLKYKKVYGDPEKLRQILQYLGSNAIQYTESGGRVTVTAADQNLLPDARVVCRFVVEDNGIGISESFLPHIFEPFERQKNTTLSGVSGAGLGLTITKNLVEMMGGDIQVSSISGEGSRFTVTLYFRVPNEREEEADHDSDMALRLLNGRKILLVEDNEINREIGVELLEDEGFLVDTAADGSIAVEKLKHAGPGEYALILMDIQMPVMDGYQSARTIRKMNVPGISDLPIVALSANAFEEDRKKAVEYGMNTHMAKPVDILELTRLMRKLLKISE